MIFLCPNCGHSLPNRLKDGIAVCNVCLTDLDSSQFNRIMSAAWMCRRQSPDSIDRIGDAMKLTETEAILVEAFILDNHFSIDEFRAALKEIGINK